MRKTMATETGTRVRNRMTSPLGWTLGLMFISYALVTGLSFAQDPSAPADESIVFQAAGSGELLGTGAKRPTPEERDWSETHMVKTKAVRLNKLGLDRVNHARKARGQRELTPTDVTLAPHGAESVGATTSGSGSSVAGASLPGTVDNSTLKYFPPIRNQGSFSSCAPFATIYYALTYMTAMARDWDAKNGGDQYRFSPKWTYNMLNAGYNVGTDPGSSYRIALKHGAATWADFPYDSDLRGWCMTPTVWRKAIGTRADQVGKVTDLGTDAGLANLKQMLVNGYILNFAVYINSTLWHAIGNDPSTPADDAFAGKTCAYLVNGTSGGHEMTIVGFNDDIWVDINGNGLVDAGEKGALRVANSWGATWNEAGFCWVSYAALRTRNAAQPTEGMFWFDEATWITARPAYSPKLVAEFTLNHPCRNQLQMTLGTSASSATAPTLLWYPNVVLSYAGGPWDLAGNGSGMDGTFCLDLSDLAPSTGGMTRYYLGMRDNTAGSPATLKAFKLIDVLHGQEVACPLSPVTADASSLYAYVDYDLVNSPLVPIASVTAAPTTGIAPLPVSFDGGASTDPDGTLTSYAWDFGDGTTGSGSTCQHTYSQPGTYTARLTVTDSQGLQNASTITVTVNAPAVPPLAALSAAPTSGTAPLPVSFDGGASTDPDGTLTAYTWDFGDGTTGSGAACQHTYSQSGTYTAKLTVTDNQGLQSFTTVTILVQAPALTINAPTNLKIALRSRTVKLTWTDKSTNETGFQIERALKSTGVFALVGTVGANTATFSETLSAAGIYSYRVRAVNTTAGAASAYSSVVSVTVR